MFLNPDLMRVRLKTGCASRSKLQLQCEGIIIIHET